MKDGDPIDRLLTIERVLKTAFLARHVDINEAKDALGDIEARKRLLGVTDPSNEFHLARRFTPADIKRAIDFVQPGDTSGEASLRGFLQAQYEAALRLAEDGYQPRLATIVRPICFQLRDMLKALGFVPTRFEGWEGLEGYRTNERWVDFSKSIEEDQQYGFALLQVAEPKRETVGFFRKKTLITPAYEQCAALHTSWERKDTGKSDWWLHVLGTENMAPLKSVGDELAAEFDKQVFVRLVREQPVFHYDTLHRYTESKK